MAFAPAATQPLALRSNRLVTHRRAHQTRASAEAMSSNGCPANLNTTATERPQSSKPVCPLGFTSGNSGRLSQFHCPICKSLLYDCVRTSCGHHYCAYCSQKLQDCAVCGCEVDPATSLTADPEMQGMVQTYVDAHYKDHSYYDLVVSAEEAETIPDNEKGPVPFFLQLGMRSKLGGNAIAARHWLDRCLTMMDEAQDSAALRNQRATVEGMIADCRASLGDTEGAISQLQQSIDSLVARGGPQDAEVVHTLTVSYNKLGDIYYKAENWHDAAACYNSALELRRKGVEGENIGVHNASKVMDLCIALCKNADVMKRGGSAGTEDAQALMDEATEMLQQLQKLDLSSDPRQAGKLQGLQQYLQREPALTAHAAA